MKRRPPSELARRSPDPYARTAERIVTPAWVIAQARHRAAARRTLTQQLMGDPPPGYSALDKIGNRK